ncbi:MAG TPA: hypothetical protein VGS15_06910 [Candidatus Acidoferrales bacterium]|nr:hypothetical protein [Candidatus Acidoferrales bacterium]
MPAVADRPAPPKLADASNQKETDRMRLARNVVLRGFIRRADDGVYEGICLTLNLAVRGKSLEEVDNKLRNVIIAYLSDATREGNWDDFVPRRAPLSYYITYYWYGIRAKFHAVNHFKLFVESAPCPANA